MPSKVWKEKNQEKLKQYRREWYYRNSDKVKATTKANRQALKEWFADYKSTLSCERCGFSHPAALDFHHSDPTKKDGDVAYLAHAGGSKQKLLDEISKCIVLCANCHRIHHSDESGAASEI